MQAELVLKNAAIYTMDPARPRARHLAVAAGRILACGDDPLDELIGPTTRIFDLGGRAVVPGFVDAHVHFASYALSRQEVDLDDTPSLESGLAELRTAASRLSPGRWLRGRGWDRNRWGRLPVAADLDAAVGERPAALDSRDGHSIWLNTAALRQLGIDRHTVSPPGGVIVHDARGEPTGVLSENAQHLIAARLPRPSADEIRTAIRGALPIAAAAGLTGIHNFEDYRSREAFQELEAAGELTLRVYHGVARAELVRAREQGLRTGAGSDWLRVGPLKLFVDGALGSRTAYLLDPYEHVPDPTDRPQELATRGAPVSATPDARDDGSPGAAEREARAHDGGGTLGPPSKLSQPGARAHTGDRGVATLEPAELADAMRLAADAELDLAVHAIGDAAVRSVLDVYQATRSSYPTLARRLLRVEHAQLIHPTDVPRFAQLGVIASMQPVHATSDWRAADTHWGARAQFGYAWRSLLTAGAHLAFGTDAPVETLEPLVSLYAATTRRDRYGEPPGGWYPSQVLSLEEAVRAYTTGSAVAERALDRRGSLRPGHDADLVVLSPDPFPLDPSALGETRVSLTVVGGHITFEGD